MQMSVTKTVDFAFEFSRVFGVMTAIFQNKNLDRKGQWNGKNVVSSG